MINWLIKALLSNRYIYDIAKNSYNTVSNRNRTINTDIPEITPFSFIGSDIQEKRINLLVPALSEKHVFGGIATALRFFEELTKLYPLARIIVTDETSVQLKNDQFYSNWNVQDIGNPDLSTNLIVVSGNRVGQDLPIAENDYFLTTAWWTTFNAFKMLDWQKYKYQLDDFRKLIYFVQDFEPGFYSWSTRYALSESTYRKPNKTIPIFNTKLLNDFFLEQGYKYDSSFYFDPLLNPVLNKLRQGLTNVSKEKQILIYGRPSVERNLFELIVQSLNYWAEKDERSSEWKVLSAGEYHEPIELPNGLKIESVGKLSLEEYADLLARSSIGVSLMLSPHPSYPPLEMSMFGMKVITNTYANKDLRDLVSNVYCPKSLDPEDIYLELKDCCRRDTKVIEHKNEVFSNSEIEFPFVDELVKLIR
ncbi:glycosyltransferase involved in cell wall biosynthesis [Vibrio diazotrophicus]|uniref:Glycosyltransferase involved in cell wall biosynthesis n=1 Tax=Vibrio diazotrophicus TaxID=685 RepID=A0A329E9A4_VIBDI|nr:hypothetical protein [Vibrio diazotrophicus]RAS55677.1 glycosyltransferase involved in cell wall biosynthesis [Vibrio diazotrophicus]